jgi:gluconolactonase
LTPSAAGCLTRLTDHRDRRQGDGDWHVVVEDPHEDALATFLDRLETGTAVPDDLLACAGPRLQFPTSVCFAGQDLRTAYVGSLGMSRLPTLRAPIAGLPMRHWS